MTNKEIIQKILDTTVKFMENDGVEVFDYYLIDIKNAFPEYNFILIKEPPGHNRILIL